MENKRKTTVELSAENPAGGYFYAELDLPATEGELRDAMHKLRNSGFGDITILNCPAIPELSDTRLDVPTIDELNFFAERVSELPEEEITALNGVFNYRKESGMYDDGLSMKELINMTYQLESVMIAFNVGNDEALGEFVIENGLNSDIAEIPENALHLLDKVRIGELQREIDGGVFVDGKYVVAGEYQLPEVYDGENLPMKSVPNAVFRLQIAESGIEDADEAIESAEWLNLPIEHDEADLIAQEHNEEVTEDCAYYGFESEIPQISRDMVGSMQDFELLNQIAYCYRDMSELERMTFKAAMQAEHAESLAAALDIAEHVSEYELAPYASDEGEFFKDYLTHQLGEEFDSKWLDAVSVNTENLNILDKLGGQITDYGIISQRGESLYRLVSFDDAPTEAESLSDGEIFEQSDESLVEAEAEAEEISDYGFSYNESPEEFGESEDEEIDEEMGGMTL